MFNFLKGGKVNLTVTLDRPSGEYSPGESVNAIVNLSTDKELKVRQGRVVLSCEVAYQYKTTETTTDSDGDSETRTTYTWVADTKEIETLVFLDESVFPGGTTQRYEFTARLPEDALPAFEGKITRIRWLVQAKLDRKLAGDILAEAAVMVLNAPTGAPIAGQFGQSSEPGEAEMSFELPGSEWSAGDTLAGRLLIQPHKSFDATEIRIELECCEDVPYDEGNREAQTVKVKLAGKTHLQESQMQALPFQVALPKPCLPTMYAEDWSVSWKLKGIIARFLRKDTSVVEEMVVYTGRVVR